MAVLVEDHKARISEAERARVPFLSRSYVQFTPPFWPQLTEHAVQSIQTPYPRGDTNHALVA